MFFHPSTYAAFRGEHEEQTLEAMREKGWIVSSSGLMGPTKPKVLIVTENAKTYTELKTTTTWIQSGDRSAQIVDVMIRGLYTSALLYKAGIYGFTGDAISQFWLGEIDAPTYYPFTAAFAKSKDWFKGAEVALGISIPVHSLGDQCWMLSKTEYFDSGLYAAKQVVIDALSDDHGTIVCKDLRRCEEISKLYPPMKIVMDAVRRPSVRWYDQKASKFHEKWCL